MTKKYFTPEIEILTLSEDAVRTSVGLQETDNLGQWREDWGEGPVS